MMTAEQKAAWLAERAGKLTASRMPDAMDFLRNGEPSRARVKLLYELLAEQLTGHSVPHVVVDPMRHGLEYEDEAVDVFVGRYPCYSVKVSRFYDHPTIENFGATPDRECDEDGLLEIKCPQSATYVEWVTAGVVPEKHKPQMAAQLLCTGRKWVGFIAYDPRVRDERMRLFMRKFEPTQEYLRMVEDYAVRFLGELDEAFDQFVTKAA